ncbi:MAG: permease, partial [Anaerolineaceae bacterium]|nr:permease [Anaerolineaceae bacterium]
MLSSRSIPLKKISRAISQAIRQFPGWVTLLFLIGAAINLFGIASGSLPFWAGRGLDVLSNFSAVFLGIFIEALPFLLLGTLASGFVEVFIEREELARWIPRQPVLGVLAGGLLGLFFPVCECGVVPFTRRLLRKGVPVSVGVTTLLAAPVVNPIVIASTYAAFGPGLIFWGRIGLSLLIAVITGLVFSMQVDLSSLLRDEMNRQIVPPILTRLVQPDREKEKDFPKASAWDRIRRALIIAVDEFFEMGRYLIFGSLLAALM